MDGHGAGELTLLCKVLKIPIYLAAIPWLLRFALGERHRPPAALWVLGAGSAFLLGGAMLDLAGLAGLVSYFWRGWVGELVLANTGLAMVFLAACWLLACHGRLCRLLRREAETDDLTGLANRRAFFAALGAALANAGAKEREIGVALLDVDDLKGINDALGHQAGDGALVVTARALRRSVRETDLAARIGGDEFAVLFCDAGPEPEAFRERLARNLTAEGGGPAGRLRLSLGFARFPEDGGDADALLRAADARMYADKRAAEEAEREAQNG
jgi:diguanylate cyclase (GGDEF)-like protein